jgi:AmiR/NasT family two-component response regulator
VIERAKGRLMTVARLSEDDAFRWLRTRAMQTRSTLADVAHIVLVET